LSRFSIRPDFISGTALMVGLGVKRGSVPRSQAARNTSWDCKMGMKPDGEAMTISGEAHYLSRDCFSFFWKPKGTRFATGQAVDLCFIADVGLGERNCLL